jgi:hypothetical protein
VNTVLIAGPEAAEGLPEESVQGVQCWPRPFALEHGDLLSDGGDFEGRVAAILKADTYGGRESGDENEHGNYVSNMLNIGPAGQLALGWKLLNS